MWRHCPSFFCRGILQSAQDIQGKVFPPLPEACFCLKKIVILQKLAETLTRISPPSLLFSFRLAFSLSFHYVSSASWLQAMTKATRYTNSPHPPTQVPFPTPPSSSVFAQERPQLIGRSAAQKLHFLFLPLFLFLFFLSLSRLGLTLHAPSPLPPP